MTWEFEGTASVLFDGGSLLPGFLASGDPVSGSFTFDTDAVDSDPDPDQGQYDASDLSLTAGALTFEDAAISIEVQNDVPFDGIIVDAFPDLTAGGGGFVNVLFTVTELRAVVEPLDVAIDIKPWSVHNRIHPKSIFPIPVAVLGSEDFDAADVDVTTLAFGPDAAAPTFPAPFFHDVNGDGLADLVAFFRPRDTGIAAGDVEACLTGETLGGIPFEGCDGILVVTGCGGGFAWSLPLLGWPLLRRARHRARAAPPCADQPGAVARS